MKFKITFIKTISIVFLFTNGALAQTDKCLDALTKVASSVYREELEEVAIEKTIEDIRTLLLAQRLNKLQEELQEGLHKVIDKSNLNEARKLIADHKNTRKLYEEDLELYEIKLVDINALIYSAISRDNYRLLELIFEEYEEGTDFFINGTSNFINEKYHPSFLNYTLSLPTSSSSVYILLEHPNMNVNRHIFSDPKRPGALTHVIEHTNDTYVKKILERPELELDEDDLAFYLSRAIKKVMSVKTYDSFTVLKAFLEYDFMQDSTVRKRVVEKALQSIGFFAWFFADKMLKELIENHGLDIAH